MAKNSSAPTRRSVRLAALAIAVLMVGAACAPNPSGPSDPPANAQFCEFWDEVAEAPPAADNAVLVKDEVVAMADDTLVIGQECTDSSARVELDGAVVAEGEEVAAEQSPDNTETIAAVTGDEIAAGTPVLENIKLSALSARIDSRGITIRGNVAVRLSGTTSTIGFTGTLSNLENWSVNLSSSSLTLPGITSTPATFSGTLSVRNGVPSLALTAGVTSAKIGDVTVTGARVDVAASPSTGVQASVAGAIKIGPSTVSGTVDVDFDRAGTLVSANADISARLKGTQAGGKQVDLEGTVKLEGNARETVASFSGSGIVGDLVVNEANGSLTLSTNKAIFSGVLDAQQGANSVRFNGTIVWDGITAAIPFLQLQGEGEISGTLQDGQRVAVAGTLETEIIGGQVRGVIDGSISIGTLKAAGRVVVESNGSTTRLEIDGNLVGAGFGADLDGVVEITDGRAELVQLDAVVDGSVRLGDLTLTGATLSVRSTYGNPLELAFTGGLQVGSTANLTGSVSASIGPNGTLLALQGSISGSMQLDTWGLINFNGSVVATIDQVTLTGAGGISLANFPAGLQINGTFTSSLTQPTWSLSGAARFRIGSLDIASARVNLSKQAGMQATRVGFYFSIIGIPSYFEGNFYLKPTGGCTKVDITAGSPIAKLLLVTIMPGVVGCPVNI